MFHIRSSNSWVVTKTLTSDNQILVSSSLGQGESLCQIWIISIKVLLRYLTDENGDGWTTRKHNASGLGYRQCGGRKKTIQMFSFQWKTLIMLCNHSLVTAAMPAKLSNVALPHFLSGTIQFSSWNYNRNNPEITEPKTWIGQHRCPESFVRSKKQADEADKTKRVTLSYEWVTEEIQG